MRTTASEIMQVESNVSIVFVNVMTIYEKQEYALYFVFGRIVILLAASSSIILLMTRMPATRS